MLQMPIQEQHARIFAKNSMLQARQEPSRKALQIWRVDWLAVAAEKIACLWRPSVPILRLESTIALVSTPGARRLKALPAQSNHECTQL